MNKNLKLVMTKKIFHRNDVRPALIGMSLAARRLMYICLADLPKEKNLETGKTIILFNPDKVFEVKVIDYAHMCNIDYSAAYRQIVDGVKDLMGFVLTLDHSLTKQIDPDLPKDWISPFQIATDGTGYSKGEGFVRIKFHSKLAPLISDFTQGFTGQFLQSAISIPESNSSKLYLVLREWVSGNKHKMDKEILFDEFKDILGVSKMKNYTEFQRFKESFFNRAIRKLIEKTEFSDIQMEIIERRSRKAYKLKISWKLDEKELLKKEMEIEEFQGRFEKLKKVSVSKKEEVKQINGRFMTKAQALRSGYDW